MRVKLQVKELQNGVLPYPFFINERGLVGRQDFWKGKPKKLIGLAYEPVAGAMDLSLKDFMAEPQMGVGMYAIFEKKGGLWYTLTNEITSVEILEDKE